MPNIQTIYSKKLQLGQVGAVARPSAPYDIDKGIAGVEMKPGQGCYFDTVTDKFILPVDAATRKLVTHTVSFNQNSFNTDIGSPSGNNLSEVVFAVGDVMPLLDLGSTFVIAGETVKNGEAAIFNEATGKWIKYATVVAIGDVRKKAFRFHLEPGKTAADGEIVEIKVPTLTLS